MEVRKTSPLWLKISNQLANLFDAARVFSFPASKLLEIVSKHERHHLPALAEGMESRLASLFNILVPFPTAITQLYRL